MMKLQTPKCPQCQSPAIGTMDTVKLIARFNGDPSEGWQVDLIGWKELKEE